MHPLALALAILLPHPQEPSAIELDALLVVEASAPGRRSPVVVDAVEAQVVRGTFAAPSEGLEVPRAAGEPLVWRAIEAGEDGWLQDAALRGGWGYATVELAEPAVMILDASGHRRVYVNGEPRMGDVYGLGITQLPVALRAGTNTFLFRGGRGRLRATLRPAPEVPYLVDHDRVVPDVLREEPGARLVAGVRVGNPTDAWVEVHFVASASWGSTGGAHRIPPLSVRSVPYHFPAPDELPAEDSEARTVAVPVRLTSDLGGLGGALTLEVKSAHGKHKRTFVSEVDGSVQYYAVTPPPAAAGEGGDLPGFVLSLHGASVEATNQAYSYAPKDDLVIVAPTNRRPFGFDWEDWGRYDALEVYALARDVWKTDPRRQYLTGHSMGGHGTWNLGAHKPGTFAAIAPSAGWRDFQAYGARPEDPEHPVDRLLADAANPSRTLLLKENYLHAGVYVLHGDADATVGVEQARFMRAALGEFHPNFAYYERPGAGHWWGNECMDWPPLFDFLRDNRLPAPEATLAFAFTTVNPAVHATTHWVTIHTQTRSLEPSRVQVELKPGERRVEASTENVHALSFDLTGFALPRTEERDGETVDATVLPPREPITIAVDGQELTADWSLEGYDLFRGDDGWTLGAGPDLTSKGPARAGPFKDAFRGRMAFVYGTGGDDARDALLMQKARYDGEVFGYRGNGSVDVYPDTEFDPTAPEHRGRHVILFGNADDNVLWEPLLGSSPVQVRDGSVTVGERSVAGDDLVCLLVRPHPNGLLSAVAAVAPTGDAGARLAIVPPYFVSGVGYPDWTVVGADMLEQGAEGIRAAGFFGPDWSLESGRDAWR